MLLQIALALAWLFTLGNGTTLVNDVCGTGTSKKTKTDVEANIQIVEDADLNWSAKTFLAKAAKRGSIDYVVNCRDGYIRTCHLKGQPDSTTTADRGEDKSKMDSKANESTKFDLPERSGGKATTACKIVCNCYTRADLEC